MSPVMAAGVTETLRHASWIVELIDAQTPAPRKPGAGEGHEVPAAAAEVLTLREQGGDHLEVMRRRLDLILAIFGEWNYKLAS